MNSRRRIALLHFTGPPAIGGIEQMLEMQARILVAAGYAVRLVVGEGGECVHTETCIVPAMVPVGASVKEDEGLVAALCQELRPLLADCSDCWVHNVVSVPLNPSLAAAIVLLAGELPLRWVFWCEDLSIESAFAGGREELRLPVPQRAVRWVAISATRREQLVTHLPAGTSIDVVSPPLDALTWLGLNDQTLQLIEARALIEAVPLVLVPAKLLPHKNLAFAAQVAVELSRAAPGAHMVITAASSPHQPDLSQAVALGIKEVARAAGGAGLVLLGEQRPVGRVVVRDLMLLADLVFLPSLEEGYGLPLLEAAALRVPVLCADLPVFREVAGDAATFFALDAPAADVAGTIRRMVDGGGNRARRAALRSMEEFRERILRLADPTAG